ncbi:7TM-DISM domain-containing protein [Bacillus haynesii]|uniref:7TM-DISM domain-containing protein n=1 Tax=Bacillus haynesii TaxID=1925021 RepID=UPI001F6202FC|nr:7TM-DISM domain-containing protein [Bacillus haynesii]MCI4129566.1 7TM-DISM domain-containing protein [Bacillus haynesii]
MKRKRTLIVSAVVLLFLTFAMALSVFSADGDVTTQPKVEKAGGVELEIKRFPISRYQANNEDSDDWLKGPFIGFTNVLFSTAGNVVRVVDMGMEVLNNLQPIDAFADSITNVSKRVYTTLKDNFGEALFIFAVGYILYLFAVRGSAKEAMRRSILFLVILIIGGWYMSNAGYVMKALNALSVEAQGKLLNAGNGLLGIAKDEGRFVEASNIEKGKEMEGTIAVMRNLYFDLALKKPYMIVNFGEANEKKINEKGSDDKGGMNRVDKLLSYKLSSDGEKARLEYIKSTEIDKYNNEALTSGNAYNQFGESIIGLFASIALGIPFLGLSFLNFLLQIIALVIVFFVPFAFVVAYIPQFAYSGFVSLGRLGSVYILKAMLGIVFLFVYVICFIIDTLLPPNNFGMYLLNVIVLFLTLFLGFKHRNKIVKFVTAGKVVSVDNNMMENMRRNVVQPSWESAKDVWNKTFGRNGYNKTPEDLKHSSDPSVSNNATSLGTESFSVERTPQKDQNINLLDNKKALDRKPQHSMKSEQHNNLLKKQDNERGIVLGQNNGPDNDGLRKEEEQFKRAPAIRNTEIEAERTDQKDFVKRNRFNDSQNQYNSTVDIQQEQKGDNPRKAPIVQENIRETERTKQSQFAEIQEEKGINQPTNVENIRTLNKENVNSNDVKIVRSNTPSSSVQTGNFFSGEKQNNPSSETHVNREAAVKKVAPKDSGFKRSDQTVALNDIASRTSSKAENRLRSDKRS